MDTLTYIMMKRAREIEDDNDPTKSFNHDNIEDNFFERY